MKVDDLTLIKCIGKGNFGEVYLTKKKGKSQLYATKKMDKAMCEKPENLKRLTNEIQLLSMINHTNIIKLIGLKKTQHNWYLVTEYCNGGSLSDNLKKYMASFHKPFSEEIVQYFMKQIVNALNYLHLNKIIHRDLKLDNILLNFPSDKEKNSLNLMKSVVKIIDFGFATKLSGKLAFTALGTPTNMDPKILRHINTGIQNTGYDEKADIWSLGTLCYEMLVGHMAFSGKSMRELYQEVINGTYFLPVSLSKEVVSFINGMLQQDPHKRLTASQLLNHDFLTKHPSKFQPVDVRKIPGTLAPGGVIKMKSNNQPQINDQPLQLWAIFNQPGIIPPAIPAQISVPIQPQIQIAQQAYSVPQQQVFINQPVIQQLPLGGYY